MLCTNRMHLAPQSGIRGCFVLTSLVGTRVGMQACESFTTEAEK